MKTIYRCTILLMFPVLLLTACKKNIQEIPISITDETVHAEGIQPYPFNWETADFVPTPPTDPAIPVPWGGGANRRFTDDILTDYHSNDGWVLVYNLFNTNTTPVPGYFTLYNRYRGLLRIYFYLPSYSPVPSNYVTYNLSLGGTNPTATSLLNYAGTDVTDVTVNLPAASQVQPYQLVATGAWYATEFELAYDPNLQNLSCTQVNLGLQLNSTNITQVNLDGTQTGTLEGTIQTPAAKPDVVGTLVKGAFYATGIGVLNNNGSHLPAFILDAMKKGLQDGLNGAIKNILSGTFGGSSGNTQQVHLNFNTEIKLNGTETSNTQILANSFYIPSTAGNQTAQGYSPGFNDRVGVFTISNRPTLKRTVTHSVVTNTNGVFDRYRNSYVIDPASFSFIWNPDVINASSTGATIQNIDMKCVVLDPEPVFSPETRTINGTHEQIGKYDAYSASNLISTYTVQAPVNTDNENANRLVLRVSFDVVPNNGAPKATIVKAFTANVVTL
jgi:hypothetical protein